MKKNINVTAYILFLLFGCAMIFLGIAQLQKIVPLFVPVKEPPLL